MRYGELTKAQPVHFPLFRSNVDDETIRRILYYLHGDISLSILEKLDYMRKLSRAEPWQVYSVLEILKEAHDRFMEIPSIGQAPLICQERVALYEWWQMEYVAWMGGDIELDSPPQFVVCSPAEPNLVSSN